MRLDEAGLPSTERRNSAMRCEKGRIVKVSICLVLGLGCFIWSANTVSSYQSRHAYTAATPLAEPRIFAEGVISTTDDEFNVAFTPDGNTIYFTKSVVGSYLYAICASHFKSGKWSVPEVATFSGLYSDFDPFISPDGSKLYFVSDRPLPGKRRGNVDIWVAYKTATGWSEPQNLGAPINTDAADWYPTVTADHTLYFASGRPGGKGAFDIYRSRLLEGKYSEPVNLGDAVNSQYDETEVYIAPNESFMIFISIRPGGYGHMDLYISYNRGGAWTKAENLGPKINSEAYDLSPLVSPDGKYFFFASDRGFATAPLEKRLTHEELVAGLRGMRNGLMSIYQVDISALKLKP
jgi:Tol biopolymer transport system component